MAEIFENVSLRNLNTFGIESRARRFTRPKTKDELIAMLQQNPAAGLEKRVLGGGSNILITGDVDALVIRYDDVSMDVVRETDEHVWLRVGGGHNWHDLVVRCIETGLAGIENLSLIPGNVGAAPIQNIGAYGVELAEVFDSLEAVELSGGEVHAFSSEECGFGYRDSIFKNREKGRYLITDVVLRLNRKPDFRLDYGDIRSTLDAMGVEKLTIGAVSEAVCRIRRSKLPDPARLGNAGSYFKNPVITEKEFEKLRGKYPVMPGYPSGAGKVKIPAGWLIEKAGWKGRRIGETGTHEKQALVIVNYGMATGQEILDYSAGIAAEVESKFGITLTPEVNIW
ncbi:MAG: UDP-N-acetylmuramate dehydrogenase [Balneolaceae bacterium]|nr:MAG: UDP-N-acetylmuramate dehydrogenase [Balneolaceae bacterium]